MTRLMYMDSYRVGTKVVYKLEGRLDIIRLGKAFPTLSQQVGKLLKEKKVYLYIEQNSDDPNLLIIYNNQDGIGKPNDMWILSDRSHTRQYRNMYGWFYLCRDFYQLKDYTVRQESDRMKEYFR